MTRVFESEKLDALYEALKHVRQVLVDQQTFNSASRKLALHQGDYIERLERIVESQKNQLQELERRVTNME